MPAETKIVYPVETEEAFVSKILEHPDKAKLLVLDVFTEWCGPCKELIPTFKSLQMNTDFFDDRVQIFTVERSVYPDFKERFPVTSQPKFLLYKGGEEIMEIIGVDAPKLLYGIVQNMPALAVEE
jgi:thiol-disulfide isomerase/thioredoxin